MEHGIGLGEGSRVVWNVVGVEFARAVSADGLYRFRITR